MRQAFAGWGEAVSEAQIKPAAGEHLPAIQELATIIWHAHYPGIISADQIDYMLGRMYSLPTLRAEIETQAIRYERLLIDDRLVGFAAFGPTAEPEDWKLHKLYLLPEQHRRGLGSQLLRHCETQARSFGARRLLLNVNKRNTKAIAAYQRNGYTFSASVQLDIGNGFVMDDFVMTKSLS